MLLFLAIGAIMKSAPVTTRDHSSQADIVLETLMRVQYEIFELGQVAARYDDRECTSCDYALTMLSEIIELLELPDPRFKYDDLSTLYYEVFTDAANSWDPDDAQSTAEPESIAHAIY